MLYIGGHDPWKNVDLSELKWGCCICGKTADYNLYGKKYCKEHYVYDGTKESYERQERLFRSHSGKK